MCYSSALLQLSKRTIGLEGGARIKKEGLVVLRSCAFQRVLYLRITGTQESKQQIREHVRKEDENSPATLVEPASTKMQG